MLRIFCLGLLAFSGVASALAEDARVTAALSNSETAIGQPVQLQIQVTGVSNPKPPGDITVDGLEIQAGGTSRQYQMNNFNVSYSFTFTYTILPTRTGTFKIPAQEVAAGSTVLRTPELTLNVAASAQSPRSSRSGSGTSIDSSQIGFVEMLLPKSVAYVGEMIPVQVRLGINLRTPPEALGSGIQILGQGFTTQKLTDPRQTIETINGQSYQMFIFKTAIAPVRSGKLEIGPTEINPVVRIPRARTGAPNMPRGGPFDDPFFNSFFNDPALAPSMPKEIHLKSETATLEVKPLPPNAPAEFSGAIGNFSMKSDANPKKSQVGDPITVNTTITGRGNFDRVNAPVLADDRGWHKYPPSENFKRDDDVGISGAKSFETVLTAKENKPELPPMVFSFFDPIKENYITLRSDAIPLQIEGGPAPTVVPAPAPAVAPSPGSTPAVTPKAAAPKPAEDILPQLDDRTGARQTFTPLYEQRAFWLAQLVPALALAGFIGWKLRQARLGNREANRIARLRDEMAELQRKMRSNGTSPQEYMAQASRAVQLKTALASGSRRINPNVVDAETAAVTFRLDEEARVRLRQLFEQSDELRYSGGRNGNEALSAEQRRAILDLVENLRA